MRFISVLLLVGLLAWPLATRAGHCEFRRLATDASDANRVHVEAVAGNLRIRGEEGLSEVKVRAEVCGPRRVVDDIDVIVEPHDDHVDVAVDLPHRGWLWPGFLFHGPPRVHLVIAVPEGIAVDVTDGSGDTEISGVGATRVRDGSGNLSIDGVVGSLLVEDGSGDLDVRHVEGPVEIRDGSGNVEVRETGDVTVRDGSGNVYVYDIDGTLRIESDGSGNIEARTVARDVVVDSDGSGNIEVDGVEGDLRVHSDGSGDVRYRKVAGRVELPRDW